MIVGIHQPHYLPWLGYMDKMAKSDKFIIMDEVQLEPRSPMVRNKLLEVTGRETFLTVNIEKKGYRDKKTSEILLSDIAEIQKVHRRFIDLNYSKTLGYKETIEKLEFIWSKEYKTLLEIQMDTILCIKEMLEIPTDLIFQSHLTYDRSKMKNELLIELLKAVSGNIYLSGNGAKKYMDKTMFEEKGIHVIYQEFSYPKYNQYRQEIFVPNLSSLDILFQCGVDKAKTIFWDNVKKQRI